MFTIRAISSNINFMSIVVLFNNLDRIKFICFQKNLSNLFPQIKALSICRVFSVHLLTVIKISKTIRLVKNVSKLNKVKGL